MGRTSNAVTWGTNPNYWSNPALLALQHGVQYEWGRTQLVPDLADDVYFKTRRLTAGYWGLGILMAGRPLTRLGGMKLNYGESIATDVDGNFLGTFTSYEEVHAFGAAANLLEFAEHALSAGGLEPPSLTRFGDVAIGWCEKKTHVFLAPADLTQDRLEGAGDVTTYDSGLLVRLTPYDAIDHAGFLPALDRIVRTRIDVSHGRSTQNYNDTMISYIDQDQADPVARIRRIGWAAHVALGLPHGAEDVLRSNRLGWLPRFITPLVQWGKAWDREVPMVPDPATGTHPSRTRIMKQGWEVTFANIYSIRKGRIDDPVGTIQGTTSGWSLGLNLKDLAGFSFDRATVPQSIFLEKVHRKAFSFYVNPVSIWAALR